MIIGPQAGTSVLGHFQDKTKDTMPIDSWLSRGRLDAYSKYTTVRLAFFMEHQEVFNEHATVTLSQFKRLVKSELYNCTFVATTRALNYFLNERTLNRTSSELDDIFADQPSQTRMKKVFRET